MIKVTRRAFVFNKIISCHPTSTYLETMAERSIFFILILTLSCYFFSNLCHSETTDTLHQGQQLKDWDELISSNRVFRLKFFGFGTSISPYLGIFYNYKQEQSDPTYIQQYNTRYIERSNPRYIEESNKAVWVANRNNPITDISGKLMIDVHGKLSVSSSGGTILDLFSPTPVTRNARAKLLNSGNFILQELYRNGSVKQVLWQSFDYPTDTLLPGMKLGINPKTGHRWSLTSWASDQLPADGSYRLTGDHNGKCQLVIVRRGNIHWMSGSWWNGQFKNTDLQSSGPNVHLYYISNETEQSFTYLTKTYDSFPALTIYPDGHLNSSTLHLDVHCPLISHPEPACVEYESEKLKCRKHEDFGLGNRLDSQRYGPGRYGHWRYGEWRDDYIFMDEYEYDESYNFTLDDCKRKCWRNCSCTAYTYANKNGAGCKTYAKAIYNPEKAYNRRDTEYYIFGYQDSYRADRSNKVKWIWLIIVIGSLATLLACYFVAKKLLVKGKVAKIQKWLLHRLRLLLHQLRRLLHRLRRFYNNEQKYKKMNNELHYFTFQSISSATNNFSSTNKLGEGGFGAVYKGKLMDGQEVAVKRLSRRSTQGDKEFKNETQVIAQLQHTNLVKLIGCCIDKQEKILVYEYMPNNSLDFFLFDPRRKGLLEWKIRFVIIEGVAQGLLYLHKFSRLRVIHRDLKASNILLDDYLNPKISDFGMAKLFGINESEANTSRVVGTRGYMPPEYMIEGVVSTKTDVFGFGVLLLEIVSSKMNHGSHDVEHPLNLLGLAWELWDEGRGLELMDPVLEDSCSYREVMTCIHVGLLCVQDHAMDRPTMSEVISMLTNENMHLPEPKRPAFFIERHEAVAEAARDNHLGNGSVNGQSISILVAR